MGYNYDDVYHQKMMHWQKQKGHYEPVYIHFHHDPKEQKRQMEAAAQPLPAQLLRSVLSPMSGLLGGLQNLKVSGHQYVKDATKTFISPPMSPILAPSMSAQSPSPPQSPTAEKDFRGLTPLSPPESSKNSLHDELIAQRAETPPALRRKQMEVDPDFYGFQFTMPDFIASKPVLSNLFATLATFAGPPVFIYTFFISGSLIFALSLALPICIIGALCFTIACAAFFGIAVVLPSTFLASIMAVMTWMAGWISQYATESSSRTKPKKIEGVELPFRS